MTTSIANEAIVGRLAEQADVVGRLAKDPGAFATVFAAFESRDPDAFRWVLERLELLPRCELICEWVRIKHGVLRCAELCGPIEYEWDLPNPRALAEAIVRLASNERLLRRVVDAVVCADADDYREAIRELELERFCHLICRWVYTVIYDRVCEVICSPQRVYLPDPVADVHAAARALRPMIEDEALFAAIDRAAVSLSAGELRNAIDQAGVLLQCEIICRLICVWRGVWVCRLFCEEPTPILRGPIAIDEARAFALAAAPLAAQPRVLGDLVTAAEQRDPKAYRAIIDRFGLVPYCGQVCGWVTSLVCAEFCIIICHNNADAPLFTKVGYFDIISDIDPGTGLTNKSLSYAGLDYGGGPNFAFWRSLSLNGFCPSFSNVSPGVAMKYRFLYDAGSGPLPITGDLVCPTSAGSRLIDWPINIAGVAQPATSQQWQSVQIHAAPAPVDPTPPAAGSAWYGPGTAYIAPDADGWIVVDPNAVGGGFQTLLCFDTTQVVAGGAPSPGVGAGTPVPAAAQRAGADLAITFEATRVTLATIDHTNTLSRIRINNWSEVNEINFVQFVSGCCTPIDLTLGVQATFDHEQMAAGAWSLGFGSCSPSAPPVIGLSTSLTAGITSSATLLDVASGSSPPAPFDATVLSTGETMTADSVVATQWTVTRGGGAAAAAAGADVWAASPGMTFTTRSGAGVITEDTSAWQSCSYTAVLTTRPGLTTGLQDYDGASNPLTFCICGH